MAPEVFTTQNLLRLFYSCSPARLNKQGESLLSLVTFDQKNSTPDSLIYTLDDCILPGTEPFMAVNQILATLLETALSEISDGALLEVHGQTLVFHPVLIIEKMKVLLKLERLNTLHKFSLN